MIVRTRPNAFRLLFALRGSIIPLIAPRVLVVGAVSVCVTIAQHLWPAAFPQLPSTPFTLLGLGLSIFLGFRNSACYDRWWDARKQWGQLVIETRSLSRSFAALQPDGAAQRLVADRLIAFAHALAVWLRGQGAPVTQANPPDAILRTLSADLAATMRRGVFGEISFAALNAHAAGLCAVQAACERIRNTPTPFAYTLLLHRTAWLFCLLVPFALSGIAAPLVAVILAYAFFGLDALGDELEEPFALRPNTIPMDAIVRMIEIELRQNLGDTDLPPPLQPVDFILT